ncbi:MAG: cell division protein FtsL [Gammaproteobacteria bacterium]
MNKGQAITLVIVGFWVVASALGVIYSKHQSRKLFIELEALKAARDELNIEWGKLQLEQSTLAMPNEIEVYARNRLAMQAPVPEKIVIVTP